MQRIFFRKKRHTANKTKTKDSTQKKLILGNCTVLGVYVASTGENPEGISFAHILYVFFVIFES